MSQITRRNLIKTGTATAAGGALGLSLPVSAGNSGKGDTTMGESVALSPDQEALVEVLDRHVHAEFEEHSAEAAMETMSEEPHLINIPTMTGSFGRAGVYEFYSRYFIPGLPPDTEVELLTRTVGQARVIIEIIFKLTHTIPMPWFLPGIAPTGRRVEVPMVVIVQFREGKIESEHIFWDQASVLAQLGLLDAKALPIAGVETAHKLREPRLPSNELIRRAG
jgi:carboxymethylenebutenolidase